VSEPIKYHTPEQELARLQISERTLQRWVSDGCPIIKRGRIRRFNPADVDAWFASSRRSAQPAQPQTQATQRRRGRTKPDDERVDLSAYLA
jgi:phage terminase Nu1 subunit (DNA packaging protein)